MKNIKNKVSDVVKAMKNVLDSLHRLHGEELTEEKAEAFASNYIVKWFNNPAVSAKKAKLVAMSFRDIILQFGRWENAGKVVWQAEPAVGTFREDDISFMEKLPFANMFVDCPLHVFGRDAAGFFISKECEKRSMISFIFMEDGTIASARTIEIKYDRLRRHSLFVKMPEAVLSGNGIGIEYNYVPFRSVEEYDLHAVQAEQTVLGILKRIYDINMARPVCTEETGNLDSLPVAADSEFVDGKKRNSNDIPDFRFFGGTAKSDRKGKSRKGVGKGSTRAPHPVGAYPSHRWHRVPDDNMDNVPAGVEIKWVEVGNQKRLYMKLPAFVRGFHTGNGEEMKKTPVRIRRKA